MNEQQFRTAATLALTRLPAANAHEEHIIVGFMKDACDAIGAGDEGAHALNSLVNLWREPGFSDIDGNSISEFRTTVSASDNSANMKQTCGAVDKGDLGARAVDGLHDLWRELKLRQIDGDALSDLVLSCINPS
jgi:hypothetical protein